MGASRRSRGQSVRSKSGSISTFLCEQFEPRRLFASIAGVVFSDVDSDGKFDSSETGAVGVTVYLDKNDNRNLDASETSQLTVAGGAYTFANLAKGNFIVRQVVPAGDKQTTPKDGNGLHVTLKSTTTVTTGLKTGVHQVVSPSPTPSPSPSPTPSPSPSPTPSPTPSGVAPAWTGFAGNAQHTAVSTGVAAQDLEAIHWQVDMDLNTVYTNGNLYVHYGAPAITGGNTVIVPVKTGATGGFRFEAHDGVDGHLKWSFNTDYILPPHTWLPSVSPTLGPDGQLYIPGAGGTVFRIANPDADGPVSATRLSFFGSAEYLANTSSYNSSLYIDTPITVDAAGDLFFGTRATGDNHKHVLGGVARISAGGTGLTFSAKSITGDTNVDKVAYDAAPALSNDGKTLYVVINRTETTMLRSYLVALNSTTLATIRKVRLQDPASGAFVAVRDQGTQSPAVGPDGDVYMGVSSSPINSRLGGWLLHFNSDLSVKKTPGTYGWDDTATMVPSSLVPSYHGSSTYLVMTKFNSYAGNGGNGDNKIAIFDPNGSVKDPLSKAMIMPEVISARGVTPDEDWTDEYPNAVEEWCINTAALDLASGSIMANSEDGVLYRWDLATNTLSQQVRLSAGLGEAYTPTSIGPDGTVYAIQDGILFAVGKALH